jgi:polyisoprenoid-binding protein YceI
MANFKLFLALAACLSGQALAAPAATKTFAKRASVSDVSFLAIHCEYTCV